MFTIQFRGIIDGKWFNVPNTLVVKAGHKRNSFTRAQEGIQALVRLCYLGEVPGGQARVARGIHAKRAVHSLSSRAVNALRQSQIKLDNILRLRNEHRCAQEALLNSKGFTEEDIDRLRAAEVKAYEALEAAGGES